MKPADFDFIANLLRQRSGLVLTPDKTYLIESRLAPIARREGLGSVEELIGAVRTRRDERLIWSVTDAMTTNETFFFRDKTPFDQMRDVCFPELSAKRPFGTRVRVWSAACSTGQEAYSLAMMGDMGQTKGLSVDILGTDISDRVLEKARAGIYSQFEVQRGLPVQMLVKYFDKQDDNWRIADRLKSRIEWKRHNLLEDTSALGRFDIVLCRNVLIYFDQPTKAKILEKIASQLADDGYLILGAAETVLGLTEALKPHPATRGLYVRNPEARRAAA